jgi:hypothetical protein
MKSGGSRGNPAQRV